MRSPITWIRRLTAPVEPEPTGSTTSSGAAWRYRPTRRSAPSYQRVISRPVVEVSVWVFAMKGSTRAFSSSSTARWKRPLAIQSK
jgi:hypothetical protein